MAYSHSCRPEPGVSNRGATGSDRSGGSGDDTACVRYGAGVAGRFHLLGSGRVSWVQHKHVSLALLLLCIKPGYRPRVVYCVHHAYRRCDDKRKGFTEVDHAWLPDAAY